MSLEDKLAQLAETVSELNKTMEAHTALLKGGIAKAADKPAGKPASKPPAKGKGKAKDAVTVETLQEQLSKLLSSIGTKAERAKVVPNVKAMLEHLGVDKLGEISEEQVEETAAILAKICDTFEEGGADAVEELDLELSNEGGGEEDDSLV